MASPEKSKKTKSKPPRGRPAATSAISQPAVQDATTTTVLPAFSSNGNLFAYLSLAVDKHRLRVYDTSTSQSVAEHIFEASRATSLVWAQLQLSDTDKPNVEQPPSKKKRKKGVDTAQIKMVEVVLLGLSNGTLALFSPTHGRVIRTLSDPQSTAAILSAIVVKNADNVSNIWTSSVDSFIRKWDMQNNGVLGSWKSDDRVPFSFMALRPSSAEDERHILVANHSLRLLSFDSADLQEHNQLASFSGHASAITAVQWDASQSRSDRFISMAEADRVVSVWAVPKGKASEGKLTASIQLDSEARAISLLHSSASPSQVLLILAASGRISVFPIPAELSPPTNSSHKVSTLLPRSTLAVPSAKNSSGAQLLAASFVQGHPAQIRIARVVRGVRPVFDLVSYLDESGAFIKDVSIGDVSASLVTETAMVSNCCLSRYNESSSMAVGSGVSLGHDPDLDDLAFEHPEGELDVDLAELSLGQRLTALSGANVRPEGSDDEEASSSKRHKPSGKKVQNDISVVPASSLTRTLLQALHSSDSKLMETCLAHSDLVLIRNTVKALPPQLAVPLLTVCMERLGRGARASNMKGGGGGAGSQRGTTLIAWVKTVLAVHSGHLMTMPDLVARLSGLHATLTARIALQESLLSLSGRLDMVLSQIEMRSSVAPAPLVPKKKLAKDKNVKRYVEGESEDEEEEMDVEVEVDSGDDAGSIEDVELGGSSDEPSEEEEAEDSEDDENEDDDDDAPVANGFIDDEAEEYSDEESDSE
ncbi:NUC189-domain-containing protein [Guyanagaster necrorhizus]|uniref:NUC189-domain-containing protein n=1 Tax=Guyanagaster necrorhizus TaxID=856835 RepID=A0A9P8AW23_9AGAR|nr:NUC189-domain-containing protein [Guyanagaster necrorhizus MCA 3950]KAG7450123.1 NUC189-domain-containing protein [Guyanagaster necrorhizus MCA 3950]